VKYTEAHRFMAMCGSEDRPERLLTLAETLDGPMLREIAAAWWTVAEGWGKHGDALWAFLEKTGYITDTKDEIPCDEDGLVEIYRGNLGDDPLEEGTGHAWTLSAAYGEFFASHACSPRGAFLGLGRAEQFGPLLPGKIPTVWKGWVYVDDVLGYFTGRGEDEIVANPADVRNAHKCREAVPA